VRKRDFVCLSLATVVAAGVSYGLYTKTDDLVIACSHGGIVALVIIAGIIAGDLVTGWRNEK